MPDVFTKDKRSKVMARIRGKGNQATELALIDVLKAERLQGWRRHRPIFGKPDFVFPRARVAIFVDGCFWHRCPTHGTKPKNNGEFWLQKLDRNVARDRLVTNTLRTKGWKVIRIWEHDLLPSRVSRVVRRLRVAMKREKTRGRI